MGGHGLEHGEARERLVEVVRPALVIKLALAEHDVRYALHRPLHHDDEVFVVGIRDIQLEHRELGVVPRGHAFVAEIAVYLVHALEAADREALEEELRRDAQEHVHVERVVMRANGRAAAPPGIDCSIGVSTSRKSMDSRKSRRYLRIRVRV